MKNKERGITLIALVVTIIILLILAGVAINMALGDNGLFRRSKEAVNSWKSAETNEQSILGEIDSFLDENMNPNKVKVEYKKTPIKSGDDTVAVQIGFTVVGPTKKEVELGPYEEFINDFKKLVQGKSEEQKEEILNNIIIANKEQIDFEPKTLEGLYNKYGLEGEHRNLTELAGKMNITQEMLNEVSLVDIKDGPIFMLILTFGGAPYYRIEGEDPNEKFYKLLDEYEIGELKPFEYEITTIEENISGSGNVFITKENGTYNFNIKILTTGEEKSIQVPVTEINIQEGTEYDVISNSSHGSLGLRKKGEQKYALFNEAYIIIKGKVYDISSAIRRESQYDQFSEVDSSFDGYEYDYLDNLYIQDSQDGITFNKLGNNRYDVLIIKEGKAYYEYINLLPR